MFHHTHLSFIQLAGEIAVGVHAKQNSNFMSSKLQFVETIISLRVRTTASQVCFRLFNDIPPQAWIVASVLCNIMIVMCMTYYVGFLKFLPLDFGERLNHNPCSLWQLSQFDTPIKQTNYTPDDRDGVPDKYINSIVILDLYLNVSILAVIGIVCFSRAMLRGARYYYQFPMGIIMLPQCLY